MEADKGLGGGAKRVVVIGGGVAGSLLVKSLQFNADVTLIDPKEYYEITWAGLRSMVEPSFANRSVINHRDYFTNGCLIVSTAINITDTEVVTADGVHVIYDYLVIATGHMDPVPRSRADRLDEYKAVFVGMQTMYILWTWLIEGRPRATISALFMFTCRGILGYSTQLPLPEERDQRYKEFQG